MVEDDEQEKDYGGRWEIRKVEDEKYGKEEEKKELKIWYKQIWNYEKIVLSDCYRNTKYLPICVIWSNIIYYSFGWLK